MPVLVAAVERHASHGVQTVRALERAVIVLDPGTLLEQSGDLPAVSHVGCGQRCGAVARTRNSGVPAGHPKLLKVRLRQVHDFNPPAIRIKFAHPPDPGIQPLPIGVRERVAVVLVVADGDAAPTTVNGRVVGLPVPTNSALGVESLSVEVDVADAATVAAADDVRVVLVEPTVDPATNDTSTDPATETVIGGQDGGS